MDTRGVDRRFAKQVAAALICVFLIACHESGQLDTDQVIQEANELIASRQYKDGLEMMRTLMEANPNDAHIQLRYGEALMASGQPSLAVWTLSHAARDPEYLVPAGLLLARSQSRAGSGTDAIHTATRVLEADPENDAALLIRIEAYLKENLEEKALEDLDRLEELAFDPSRLELLRLEALLGLGKEEEAEALLTELSNEADEARELDPSKAGRLCAAMATFIFEKGDLEGAKERFDTCLEGDAVLNEVLARTAILFFDRNGEPDRATEIFKRRFEQNPKRLHTRVRYADRLQEAGRTDEGEALLIEATESQSAAWAALADLYAIAGDIPKAIDALDHVIAADPTHREDWVFSRADFLLALGKVDEAERSLASLEVPAHHALLAARIAAARGDLENAVLQFEEGIRLWPDNPDARYLAAQVYERRGEWKKAAGHYREAARMENPHYASSLALADLQRALGDIEGVNFLLARLIEQQPNNPQVLERFIEFAWDTGTPRLAARMLSRLARVRGQAPRAAALMASRTEKAEGPAAALALLDKSGIDALAPTNTEALESRVELLVALDRKEEAMELVGRAIARAPESARLLVLRASIHRAQNDPKAALADLREARERNGEFIPALLNLASLEHENGDLDIARRIYEEAIPIEAALATPAKPNESVAAIALAKFEIDAEQLDAGRSRLRGVLETNPRQGEAAWLLIQSYEDHPGRGELLDAERADLALRASVFDGRPTARNYWLKLNTENS